MLLCPAWAQEDAEDSAREAAISYLEGIGSDEALVEVLKGTVLSPFLSKIRREGVLERVRILREGWESRAISFEPIKSKVEGEYGVVIIELQDEKDPLAMEVIGLGVQRKKGEWKSAPLPGSFEGVFLGFDDEVEELVGRLERWMAAETVDLTEKRLSEARNEFQEKLASAAGDVLLKDDPKVIVEFFLAATRERDLMGALACMRELKKGPDYEWMEMKDIFSIGLQGKDSREQWRLLTDPYLLRMIGDVDVDEEEATVQVIFYDLDKSHGVCDLRFDLLKADGRWKMILPPELRFADYEEGRFRGLTRMGRENEGLDLFEKFLELFRKENEAPGLSSLEEASDAVLEQLEAGDLSGLFAILHDGELMTLKEISVQFRAAAELLIRFQESDSSWSFRRVALEEKEQSGLLVIARLDPEKLDWIHLEPIYMIKESGHWMIAPGVDEPGNFDAGDKEWRREEKELRQIFRKEDDDYFTSLLPAFSELVSQVDQDSVRWGKADSLKALESVKEFRGMLKEGKMMEALKLTAVIEPGEAIWEGMKSLTYTTRGIQQAPEVDIYHSHAGEGAWSRVSVQVAAPALGEPQFLMYLVGPTKNGPRVVMDVDLRLATNKGRELLNENKLRRLGEVLGEDDLQLVSRLFIQHTTEAKKIYEEWQKNNTSSP